MGKLTPVAIKYAKPGRHGDGDGLHLIVKPSGAKSWLLRVQTDGRRRDFGLGPLSKVPLSAARDKARELREKVFAGYDPVLARKARKAIPTFEKAARSCLTDKGGKWVEQHRAQWIGSLEDHVFGSIGSVRVDVLDAPMIADALRRAWAEVPSSARRVLQRIGFVLDYAKASGWRTADSPLRSVRMLLPNDKLDKVHFPAEPQDKLPAVVVKLAAPGGNIGSLATAFCILTAARPNEVRFAKWGDIDFAARVWTVPASKMKSGA
jgi:integrase